MVLVYTSDIRHILMRSDLATHPTKHNQISLQRHQLLLAIIIALLATSSMAGRRISAATTALQTNTAHPRLWLTPPDVTRLRGWAIATNPLFAEGIMPIVESAKQEMDSGNVPKKDCGGRAYAEYPTEAYAELFAFMSLIDPDESARADYAKRARTLLMVIMDAAAKGPATEENFRCPDDPDSPTYPPFRNPIFFTEDSDRPRWHGEAFALTVDWIYPILSAQDKATIQKVFTRWGEEIIQSAYHHPEPVGVINDPKLLEDRAQVRWAGNNYFAAHMRNLGLMSLALDPPDSNPKLQGYLSNATGAWLYLFDAATRTDARGGLLPEGLEYSPQTASYAIQFLWALKTAGQVDAAKNGAQSILEKNPFWDEMITAYLHSLSPTTVKDPELGTIYQPAWYGDAQRYRLPDFIDAFGALGAYDQLTNNATQLNALRWIQLNTTPGGAERLVERTRGADFFRSSILYFMLFDPAAKPPTDPRNSLPTTYLAPGIQRLFSRTGWGTDAAWLTYALGWNSIDHQQADGNHFEFYRHGEWLTKARTGYANIAEGIASSEFRNTLAIQNARPAEHADDDWRIDLWKRGSQWNLVATGDPGLLINSTGADYLYAAGDATNLYNSVNEHSTEVTHASRALVWLKPDFVIVYDRADAPATRFKRVWIQLPNVAKINGLKATMTTASGQQLFITALLPAGATLRAADKKTDNVGETVATGEPMKERIFIESLNNPKARFLHVLQGADPGAAAVPAVVLRSSAGDGYEGAALNHTAVLFPVEMGTPFISLTYTAPVGTTLHLITGLKPEAAYNVTVTKDDKGVTVTIGRSGTPQTTDSAGVLVVR
jgi:hypothetical protein